MEMKADRKNRIMRISLRAFLFSLGRFSYEPSKRDKNEIKGQFVKAKGRKKNFCTPDSHFLP